MTKEDRVYYVNYDGHYVGDAVANTWYLAREQAYRLLFLKGVTEVIESKLKLTVLDSRFG